METRVRARERQREREWGRKNAQGCRQAREFSIVGILSIVADTHTVSRGERISTITEEEEKTRDSTHRGIETRMQEGKRSRRNMRTIVLLSFSLTLRSVLVVLSRI